MGSFTNWEKHVKTTEGVTRVVIHGHRYLKGGFGKDGEFVIDHDMAPQFVAASPDFPMTLVLPAGYKLDSGMKPLESEEKPEPVVLKKHYDDAGAVHPHTRGLSVKAEEPKADKGKRPSDKSPV